MEGQFPRPIEITFHLAGTNYILKRVKKLKATYLNLAIIPCV
jgi:hypothetical protein